MEVEGVDRRTCGEHGVERWMKLGREGREEVMVLEWGLKTLGWSYCATTWGATVETIVTESEEVKSVARSLIPGTRAMRVSEAFRRAEQGLLQADVVMASGLNLSEMKTLCRFCVLINPKLVLTTLPNESSRSYAVQASTTLLDLGYVLNIRKLDHQRLAGASEARRSFMILKNRTWSHKGPHLVLPRSGKGDLFAILDDTIGGGWGERKSRRRFRHFTTPGWDLGGIGEEDKLWVEAPSVYRKGKCVVREMATHEKFALWDYPWSKDRGGDSTFKRRALGVLVRGPPGKMIRKVLGEVLPLMVPNIPLEQDVSFRPSIDYAKTSDTELLIKDEHLSAVKPDDAPIDFSMWALEGETLVQARARDLLRAACHRWWVRNLRREAVRWLERHPNSKSEERGVNKEAIRDCVRRAANSDFWDWSDGSRLFFWRWGTWWKSARDGEPLFHQDEPPKWTGRSYPAETWEQELKLRAKEDKLIQRRYLEVGFIDSCVPRFGVNKGDTDIRLVWDLARNGFNETIWAPSFWLATFSTLTNLMIKWLPCSLAEYLAGNFDPVPKDGKWRVCHRSDSDIGEMYLNYMLHYKERHSFGVRLEREAGEDPIIIFMRFQRLLFGMKSAPYIAVQAHARGMELILGDRTNPTNPFGWERVVTNFPFSKTYDPSLPRLMKIRKDGDLASGAPVFMDDESPTGSTKANAVAAGRRLSSKTNSLGEQNTARKRRPVSSTTGAWTGKLVHTNSPHPVKAVLQKKWKQFREELIHFVEVGTSANPKIEFSNLRAMTGRGMSQTEVYPDLKPYFKSWYNGLEAWRGGRDDEGWKVEDEWEIDPMASPPSHVDINKEMLRDAQALLEFYATDQPAVLPVRPKARDDVVYVGGDASAAGRGAGTQFQKGKLRVTLGRWNAGETARGSNWREAFNLATHLLQDIRAGRMDGKEVWLVTDNLVWSMIQKKGMSKRRGLSDLVKEIRKECRAHNVFYHPCHVSGSRMILLGFDGLSRGDFDSGVMLGHNLCDLVPMDQNAFEIGGPTFAAWMDYWMTPRQCKPMTYEQMYTDGHLPGFHLWAPAPAAALLALEELAQTKVKRPFEVCHVFVCQCLLYHEEWRRRFEKEMDFWLILKPNKIWPLTTCESLILGISFPLRHAKPWKVKRIPQVVEFSRQLQQMWEDGNMGAGDYLRQFWSCPWRFFGL